VRYAITACVTRLSALLPATPLPEMVEPRFFDLWLNLRNSIAAPPRQHDDVIVVRLDEATFKHLRLPILGRFPRAHLAALLDRLRSVEPAVVAIDLYFFGASDSADSADAALADAIRALPSVLPAGWQQISTYDHAGKSVDEAVSVDSAALFDSAASARGLIYLPSDPFSGSVVREFRRSREIDPAIPWDYPTFAEAAARLAEPSLPLPDASDLIDYYGPFGGIRGVSAYKVMEGDAGVLDALRHKVILLGTYIVGDDKHETPFGSMPGVEIHATAVSNILQGRWIHRLPAAGEAALGILAVSLLTFVILSCSPLQGLAALGSLAAAWAGGACWGVLAGFYVPGALPLTMLLLVYAGSGMRAYLIERRERQRIEEEYKDFDKKIQRSVSSQYRKVIMSLPLEEITEVLGARYVTAPIMRTDVRGYTSFSSSADREAFPRVIESYIALLVQAVHETQGTFLKDVGDGILAIWGAPLPVENAADLAVRCALLMQRRAAEAVRAGALPGFQTRVGIHYGEAYVGLQGHAEALLYDAKSPCVNIACHLDHVVKALGLSVLVTDQTAAELKGDFHLLSMGRARIGKKEVSIGSSGVFESPFESGVRADWEQALSDFMGRRWAAAGEAFLRVADPRLQAPAEYYLQQCRYLEKFPPEDGWCGEISVTT